MTTSADTDCNAESDMIRSTDKITAIVSTRIDTSIIPAASLSEGSANGHRSIIARDIIDDDFIENETLIAIEDIDTR